MILGDVEKLLWIEKKIMDRRKLAVKFVSYFVLLLIILLLIWIVIPSGHVSRHNWLVITTFFVNGILWTSLLLYEVGKHPYSFSIIHWTFFCYSSFLLQLCSI